MKTGVNNAACVRLNSENQVRVCDSELSFWKGFLPGDFHLVLMIARSAISR